MNKFYLGAASAGALFILFISPLYAGTADCPEMKDDPYHWKACVVSKLALHYAALGDGQTAVGFGWEKELATDETDANEYARASVSFLMNNKNPDLHVWLQADGRNNLEEGHLLPLAAFFDITEHTRNWGVGFGPRMGGGANHFRVYIGLGGSTDLHDNNEKHDIHGVGPVVGVGKRLDSESKRLVVQLLYLFNPALGTGSARNIRQYAMAELNKSVSNAYGVRFNVKLNDLHQRYDSENPDSPEVHDYVEKAATFGIYRKF